MSPEVIVLGKSAGDNLDFQFNNCVGFILKKIRTEKNISLETLAKSIGDTTKQSLNRYELGQARLTLGLFKKICSALNEDYLKIYNDILILYYKREGIIQDEEKIFEKYSNLSSEQKDIIDKMIDNMK
jgi:transcriptional regulator with XRE-family HTH domain